MPKATHSSKHASGVCWSTSVFWLRVLGLVRFLAKDPQLAASQTGAKFNLLETCGTGRAAKFVAPFHCIIERSTYSHPDSLPPLCLPLSIEFPLEWNCDMYLTKNYPWNMLFFVALKSTTISKTFQLWWKMRAESINKTFAQLHNWKSIRWESAARLAVALPSCYLSVNPRLCLFNTRLPKHAARPAYLRAFVQPSQSCDYTNTHAKCCQLPGVKRRRSMCMCVCVCDSDLSQAVISRLKHSTIPIKWVGDFMLLEMSVCSYYMTTSKVYLRSP